MSLVPAYLFGRPIVPEIGNWDNVVLTNLQIGSYALGYGYAFGFIAQGGALYQVDMDVASVGDSDVWYMFLYDDEGDSPRSTIATPSNAPSHTMTSGTWSWYFSPPVSLNRGSKYWMGGFFGSGGYGFLNCVGGQADILSGRRVNGVPSGYPNEINDGDNMSGYDFRFRAFFE